MVGRILRPNQRLYFKGTCYLRSIRNLPYDHEQISVGTLYLGNKRRVLGHFAVNLALKSRELQLTSLCLEVGLQGQLVTGSCLYALSKHSLYTFRAHI
jgi:hypothetical protein